ncbi:MAG: DUF4783 domain-containing protein [Chitinophagaceae bacterium]|nr:DUF4783 domain-containing protein [Chitinophagaceae bacterium]
MTTSLTYLLCSYILFSSLALTETQTLQNIKNAIKNASIEELQKYLHTSVKFSFHKEKEIIPKQTAIQEIKNIFKKHPPTDFEFIHKGQSQNGLIYSIGQYSYPEGKLIVYIVLKKYKLKWKIQNIDFKKNI